jgi:hypothetical protein
MNQAIAFLSTSLRRTLVLQEFDSTHTQLQQTSFLNFSTLL